MATIDTLTIGDIVSVDTDAEFRNDVQLDAYENEKSNRALIKSYLFSSTVPVSRGMVSTDASPVAVLGHIVEGFLANRVNNRMAIIANYGHGKSHLALALANYFGRDTDSSEVQTLLGKIDNSVNDAGKSQRFRQFKQNKGAFLVVRLRGDSPVGLREQFMRELDKAIDEHPSTVDKRPGFWYTEAERVIRGFSDAERTRADELLDARQKDVSLLLRDLKDRKDVYDLCVQLIADVKGVVPNLGGQVSLKQVMDWAVGTFCGEDGPLGGVLVIFDEFSEFIRGNTSSRAAMDLQDLLNAVDDHFLKAVFVAFGQHDPDAVAGSLSISAEQKDSIKKALNRITKKYTLYTLMEGVIDAYLKQDKASWATLTSERPAAGWLGQTTNVAYEQFKKRYEQDLRWTLEYFQSTVTYGCYPMHPVTTALLCNLRFGQIKSDAPRTVLGFVLEHLKAQNSVLAYDAELRQPRLVLPLELSEYFKAYLPENKVEAYESARNLAEANDNSDADRLLRALMLQEVMGLSPRPDEQKNFLAHSSGVPYEQAKSVLRDLSDRNIILFDKNSRKYEFWRQGPGVPIDDIIEKKIEEKGLRLRTGADLEPYLHDLSDGQFDAVNMEVAWGEKTDWAAIERIMTVEEVSSESIQDILAPTSITINGYGEGERGAVVWLLAQSDDELDWYRDNMQSEVDTALAGEHPPAVVFMMPSMTHSGLTKSYLRMRALQAFTQDDIEQVGTEMYKHIFTQEQVALIKGLEILRRVPEHVAEIIREPKEILVAPAYRAPVQALQRLTLRNALSQVYKLAYRFAPPEFRTDWKANRGNLKTAVAQISGLLMQNHPKALSAYINTNPVARDLCDKFLINTWQVLDRSNLIRLSEVRQIAQAWNYLDSRFPAGSGETQLRESLETLSNPPYGFDYNTVVLLFAAWAGYHSQDLQFSAQSRLISRDTMVTWVGKGPKEFIKEACVTQRLAISRKDHEAIVEEVRKILDQMQNGPVFKIPDAEIALSKLDEYSNDGRFGDAERERAGQRAGVLRDALEQALEYDKASTNLQGSIQVGRKISDVISVFTRLEKMPRVSLVLAKGPSPTEMRANAKQKLEQLVLADCTKYTTLNNIADVTYFNNQLKDGRKQVDDVGIPDLVNEFDKSLEKNKVREAELRVIQEESGIRAQIGAISLGGTLKDLEAGQGFLEGLRGLSSGTLSARDKKLVDVKQEISHLQGNLEAWHDQSRNAVKLADLQSLRTQVLKSANRYSGTEYETVVEDTTSRLELLGNYLSEIASIQRRVAAGEIRSALDESVFRAQVEKLVAQNADMISDSQKHFAAQAIADIDATVALARQKALAWLVARQQEASSEVVDPGLLQKLHNPPAFLPPEKLPEVEKLIATVHERIEKDTVAKIEYQFRTLESLEQRTECLHRLQAIMEQG